MLVFVLNVLVEAIYININLKTFFQGGAGVLRIIRMSRKKGQQKTPVSFFCFFLYLF